MNRRQIFIANVGEFTIRNTRQEIIKFAEGKGYEARNMKDYRLMHYYWQIADHWKRNVPAIQSPH